MFGVSPFAVKPLGVYFDGVSFNLALLQNSNFLNNLIGVSAMRKNIAGQIVSFQMSALADGLPVTVGTPVVFITIDNGTQATGAGVSTHKGNGEYSYLPTQAETNGNHIKFTMTLADAISQGVNIYPVNFDPTNSSDLGVTKINSAFNPALTPVEILPAGGGAGINADTLITNFWSESLSAYAGNSAAAKIENLTAVPNVEGSVNDAGATTTSFITTLTGYVDDFFNGAVIMLEISAGKWQGKIVTDYVSATGAFTISDPLVSAPANGVSIVVIPSYNHSLFTISQNVRAEIDSASTQLTSLINTLGVAGAGLSDLGGMSTTMQAEILAEINTALDAAIPELSVGVPAATPSLRTGLMLLYMALRNKVVTQTSGVDALELHNDADLKIASKLITDNTVDYTESKMG